MSIFLLLFFAAASVYSSGSESLIIKNNVRLTVVKEKDVSEIIPDEGALYDITSDDEGFFYITFTTSAKIYKLDKNLNVVKVFGREGNGPGELDKPNRIFCDNNRLFINNSSGNRITVFDYNGKILSHDVLANTYEYISFITNNVYYGVKIKLDYYMRDPNARKDFLIGRFEKKKDGLYVKEKLGLAPIYGTMLANQINNVVLLSDTTFAFCYPYLDRVAVFNVMNKKIVFMESPAHMHTLSPVLGEDNSQGKKYVFKLTGKEYLCYNDLTVYKNWLVGLFEGKQPGSYSMVELFSGNVGAKYLNFFDTRDKSYSYTIKLNKLLKNIVYNAVEDVWLGLDGDEVTLRVLKIEEK